MTCGQGLRERFSNEKFVISEGERAIKINYHSMNVNFLEAGVWRPFPGRTGEGSSGVEVKGNKKFPNLQI